MKVSIVIPCYNHARFLTEAIESALSQSHADVEVIVIDDGSTDDSAAVARACGVRVITQENQGLSAARNAGLAASRGEIVIFLDADDRLRPDAAAAGVQALQRAPGAILAFGRCQLIDAAGLPLPTHQPHIRDRFYEELLRQNYIWTPGLVAFRRAAFSDGGFDPRVNASADYDVYLRVARNHPFATHETVVAEYRQHGGNMSRNAVLMLETTLVVLRRQKRHAAATKATWEAYCAGVQHWREWYTERLVAEFRASIRSPRAHDNALWCAWHLLRLHPRAVVRQLARKARVLSSRVIRPLDRSIAWP